MFTSFTHAYNIPCFSCITYLFEGFSSGPIISSDIRNASPIHICHGDGRSTSIGIHIAMEMADALTYLHLDPKYPSVVYCDVKTKNIMLDNNFYIKVGDFGLCKH